MSNFSFWLKLGFEVAQLLNIIRCNLARTGVCLWQSWYDNVNND